MFRKIGPWRLGSGDGRFLSVSCGPESCSFYLVVAADFPIGYGTVFYTLTFSLDGLRIHLPSLPPSPQQAAWFDQAHEV